MKKLPFSGDEFLVLAFMMYYGWTIGRVMKMNVLIKTPVASFADYRRFDEHILE